MVVNGDRLVPMRPGDLCKECASPEPMDAISSVAMGLICVDQSCMSIRWPDHGALVVALALGSCQQLMGSAVVVVAAVAAVVIL